MSEKLIEIVFVRDSTKRETGPTDKPFKKGHKVKLVESSANRWVRRGAAELVGEVQPAEPKGKGEGDK